MTRRYSPRRAYRAELLDFAGDPRQGAAMTRYLEDGLLVVHEGHVEAVIDLRSGAARLPEGVPVEDLRGRLVMPGFIDAHVHFPQLDVIASPADHLLDWLTRHTFPAEAAFGDAGHAKDGAEFFLDELLRNGTTTAAVFPSVHRASTEAFFNAAQRRGLRMVAGKVMMDRNGPEDLLQQAAHCYEDCTELIARWHGRDRLEYAVTPRFAATSSEKQLELAAQLLDEHPGVKMQTHIAENHEEMRWIAQLFPWSRDYLGVFERFRLVRPGALFAHCIHFDEGAWKRLAAAGASAVHCPSSNLFLGSGLFDYAAAHAAGAKVALASDVGGGTSFSMLRTMHEAYKVARLRGRDFSSLDAFYLATLGGARAMGLEDRIGSFRVGAEADFVVLNPEATPLQARRSALTGSLEEKLFVLMMLGDDRSVEATYALGERVY
jgi:guanine deaminase